MNSLIKSILFLSIIIIFVSCARVKPPTLPANYFYDGSYIDIHSPNQKNWSLMAKDKTQVTFAKYGEKYNESYIARVVFFQIEKTNTEKELIEFFTTNALKSSNKERFDLLESDIKESKQRKYTCILGKMLYKDKMAKTRGNNKEILLMQVKSLYCIDPKRKSKDTGFMIGYSYRGERINSTFDEEADSFISGVEFKEYK